MAVLSDRSRAAIATCDERLQRIVDIAIREINFIVLEGHRNQADQEKAFNEGKSKEHWPNGKHNRLPSIAFDFCPFPVDWNDSGRFYLCAGVFKGVARTLGYSVRYGGDWNMNNIMSDEKFRDLGHIELVLP